jgi:hypothetical protein
MVTGHDIDKLRALQKIGQELEKANKLKELELKLKEQELRLKQQEMNRNVNRAMF